MTHTDWMARWAEAFPGKEALVDGITGRRWTYGEMGAAISSLTRFLHLDLGISTGDRVACLSLNRVETILLFFAADRLGATLVPLNTRLAPAELVYYLEDSLPRALFFDAGHEEVVRDLGRRTKLPHTVSFETLPHGAASFSEAPCCTDRTSLPEPGGDGPRLIIYTSGTTGAPKGVVLTRDMLLWNALNTHVGWGLGPADRTILHAGLFYTAGWNVFTLPLFLARGVNVLLQGFDADRILELIQEERITVFFGVPTMFHMLLESPRFADTDFSSLRFVVSGGAPLGRELFEAYRERKGVLVREGYGLTEVGPNNFLANGRFGTLGHPMPFVDMRIVDPEGRDVPDETDGELLLRGPHMCAGYWNKPQATAEAVRDGWFHTGDLARRHGDGTYGIVGRKKDMIISGGANIYPAEIEAVLATHPDILAAAVIGVPDPKWGEVGKMILACRPGATLSLEAMQAFLGKHLGKFKIPKYLAVVTALPRTASSGKVQKFLLKERYGEAKNG